MWWDHELLSCQGYAHRNSVIEATNTMIQRFAAPTTYETLHVGGTQSGAGIGVLGMRSCETKLGLVLVGSRNPFLLSERGMVRSRSVPSYTVCVWY